MFIVERVMVIPVLVLVTGMGVAQSTGRIIRDSDKNTRGVRLSSGETLFDPSQRKALSYRDSDFTVTLLNEGRNLGIDVVSRRLQTRSKVELPSEIAQVNEIRRGPNDKVIVTGMANGSVYDVVIVDMRSISISDSFFAYSPSVSPNGNYVAFVKFYPAHFIEGTDDHYVLYDVTRNAAENRPPHVAVSDHTNVGAPVVPLVANRPRDNTGVPQSQQHHLTAQSFFWQSDSERYAFADNYADQLALLLVSTSGGAPSVSSLDISRGEICAGLHVAKCELSLAGAELTPNGLLATFRGVGADSALEQFVYYRINEFSPTH